jgi:hypothetical protein
MHTHYDGIEVAAGCVETDAGRDGLRCMHTHCDGIHVEVAAGCVETDAACRMGRDRRSDGVEGLVDHCGQSGHIGTR